MTPHETAAALSAALQKLGIVTWANVIEFKDAPGGPSITVMLEPKDAATLTAALEEK